MTNDSSFKPGWTKGDPLTADNLNRFNGSTQIIVGPGLQLVRAGNTITISLASPTPASLVTVKISSVITGQVGRYNAKIVTNNPHVGSTGTLAESHVGTVAGTENAIVWHIPEIKLASVKHMLLTDTLYFGRVVGVNSANKPIILLNVLPIGQTASATTIGSAGEGSEAAETTTWSRAANGTPVNIYIQSRTAYFHAGDEKVYGYFRLFSYDACGMLLSIGTETRVEIDAPEDC